jgi:hypothetical protein
LDADNVNGYKNCETQFIEDMRPNELYTQLHEILRSEGAFDSEVGLRYDLLNKIQKIRPSATLPVRCGVILPYGKNNADRTISIALCSKRPVRRSNVD